MMDDKNVNKMQKEVIEKSTCDLKEAENIMKTSSNVESMSNSREKKKIENVQSEIKKKLDLLLKDIQRKKYQTWLKGGIELSPEEEEKRQNELDKKVRKERCHLSKRIKKYLAECDELIELLEKSNAESGEDQANDDLQNMDRSRETGWYYSDEDYVDGVTCVDKNGKKVFLPMGFHLESFK